MRRNIDSLSKEFCKRCCDDSFLRNNEEEQWDDEDDRRWKEGIVNCPCEYLKHTWDYDNKLSPSECPYRLEHMMATQRVQ